MLEVGVPIMEIGRGQSTIMNHKQVFTVLVFGRAREIKAAGNDPVGAQDHVFRVGDSMRGIDANRDAGRGEKRGGGVAFGQLTVIQNHGYGDASTMGSDECLSDGRGRKTVGYDMDLLCFLFNGLNNRGGGAARGREVDLNVFGGVDSLGNSKDE